MTSELQLQFTDDQVKLIANMVATGDGFGAIGKAIDITHNEAKVLIQQEQFSETHLAIYKNTLLQAYNRKHTAQLRHQMRMEELSDIAYGAIEKALGSFEKNPNLAVSTAWRVLSNMGIIVPAEEVQGAPGSVTQNNFFSSEKGQAAIDASIAGITAARQTMAPLNPVGAPSRHTYTGSADPTVQDAEIVPEAAVDE